MLVLLEFAAERTFRSNMARILLGQMSKELSWIAADILNPCRHVAKMMLSVWKSQKGNADAAGKGQEGVNILWFRLH